MKEIKSEDVKQDVLEKIIRDWQFNADSFNVWLAPEPVAKYVCSLNNEPAMSLDAERYQEDLTQYKELCESHHITPYSWLMLQEGVQEDDISWAIYPRLTNLNGYKISKNASRQGAELVKLPKLHALIEGTSGIELIKIGPYSCVSAELSHLPEEGKTSLQIFREEYLDELIARKYNLVHLQICQGCYNGNPRTDIPIQSYSICSTIGSQPSVTLLNPWEDNKLNDWFLDIVNKRQ